METTLSNAIPIDSLDTPKSSAMPIDAIGGGSSRAVAIDSLDTTADHMPGDEMVDHSLNRITSSGKPAWLVWADAEVKKSPALSDEDKRAIYGKWQAAAGQKQQTAGELYQTIAPAGGALGAVQSFAKGAIKGAADIAPGLYKMAKITTGGIALPGNDPVGQTIDQANAAIQREVEYAAPTEDTFVNKASGALGSSVPVLAAAAGGAGLPVLGVAGAAQGMGATGAEIEARRQAGQQISQTQQQLAEAGSGVISGAGAVLPFNVGGRVANAVGGSMARRVVGGIAGTAVEGAVVNPGSTIAENAIAKHTYDPSREYTQGAAESAGIGAALSPVFGPMAAVHGRANERAEQTRAAAAERGAAIAREEVAIDQLDQRLSQQQKPRVDQAAADKARLEAEMAKDRALTAEENAEVDRRQAARDRSAQQEDQYVRENVDYLMTEQENQQVEQGGILRGTNNLRQSFQPGDEVPAAPSLELRNTPTARNEVNTSLDARGRELSPELQPTISARRLSDTEAKIRFLTPKELWNRVRDLGLKAGSREQNVQTLLAYEHGRTAKEQSDGTAQLRGPSDERGDGTNDTGGDRPSPPTGGGQPDGPDLPGLRGGDNGEAGTQRADGTQAGEDRPAAGSDTVAGNQATSVKPRRPGGEYSNALQRPRPQFFMAARYPDGRVVSDENAGMHADLVRERGVDPDAVEFGFTDVNGKFYTRQEAAAAVKFAGGNLHSTTLETAPEGGFKPPPTDDEMAAAMRESGFSAPTAKAEKPANEPTPPTLPVQTPEPNNPPADPQAQGTPGEVGQVQPKAKVVYKARKEKGSPKNAPTYEVVSKDGTHTLATGMQARAALALAKKTNAESGAVKPKKPVSADALSQRRAQAEMDLRDAVVMHTGATDLSSSHPLAIAVGRGEKTPGNLVSLERAMQEAEDAPEGSPLKMHLHNLREIQKNPRGTKIQAVNTKEVPDGTRVVMNDQETVTIDKEDQMLRDGIRTELPEDGMTLYGKKVLPPTEGTKAIDDFAPPAAPARKPSRKLNSYEQKLVDQRDRFASEAKDASTDQLTDLLKSLPDTTNDPSDGIDRMRREAVEAELARRGESQAGKQGPTYEPTVSQSDKGIFGQDVTKPAGIGEQGSMFGDTSKPEAPKREFGNFKDEETPQMFGEPGSPKVIIEKPYNLQGKKYQRVTIEDSKGRHTYDIEIGGEVNRLSDADVRAEALRQHNEKFPSAEQKAPQPWPDSPPVKEGDEPPAPYTDADIPEWSNPNKSPLERIAEAGDAAAERIRKRNSGRTTAGVDPADVADAPVVIAGWMARGIQKGQDLLKKFVDTFGPQFRSVFRAAYVKAKDIWRGGKQPTDMDKAEQRMFAPKGGQLTAESALDLVRRKLQDRILPVKRLQEDLAGRGVKVDESRDPYLAEEGFRGRVAARQDQVEREFIRPALEKINKAGLTLKEVDEYLTALHAPSRNRVLKQRDPSVIDGSGMSDAQAQRVLLDAKFSGKSDALDEIASMVHKMNQQTLQLQRDSGLISEATYKRLKDQWEDYVPLRNDLDEDERQALNLGGGPGADGFVVKGREGKAAHGRTGEADSPFTFSMAQAFNKAARAEKNLVGRQLWDLIKEHPNSDLWETDSVPRMFDKGEDKIHPGVREKENIFITKIDGKERAIEFKTEEGQRVATAMRTLGTDQVAAVIKVMRPAMAWWRMMNTTLNPDFALPNFLRDAGTAFGVHASDSGIKRAWKAFSFAPRALKVMFDLKGNRNAKQGSKLHDYAREWMDNGGGQMTYGAQDFTAMAKRIGTMMKDINPSNLRKATAPFRMAGEFFMRLNDAVESSNRLAAYIAAREAGMSPRKATSTAQNITVNFGRRGEWTPAINVLYAFSNANVQGNYNYLRSLLKGENGRKTASALALMGVAASYALPHLLGKDKNGRDIYDTIPEWEKQTHLFLPGGFKIPIPYGFNLLYNGGRLFGEALQGRKNWGEATLATAGNMVSAFNPLGNDSSLTQALSPTLVDPLVQLEMNKNWNGNPINPQDSFLDKGKPDSEKYFRNTPQYARTIARWLNGISGGDQVTPGNIDIGPGTIAHVWDFLSGGLGRSVTRAFDLPGKATSGDLTSNDVPILRRFRTSDTSAFEPNRFRENLDKIDQTWQRYLSYEKAGDATKQNALRKDSGQLLAMREAADDARDKMRELRQQEDAAKLQGDTKAAKAAKDAQEQLAADFNRKLETTPAAEFQEDPRARKKRLDAEKRKGIRETLSPRVRDLLEEKNKLDGMGIKELRPEERRRRAQLSRLETVFEKFMDWKMKGNDPTAERYRGLLDKEAEKLSR